MTFTTLFGGKGGHRYGGRPGGKLRKWASCASFRSYPTETVRPSRLWEKRSPSMTIVNPSWYQTFEGTASKPLWLDVPLVFGESPLELPKSAEIVIVGSGLSGASAAYWLSKKGFDNIVILDFRPDDAATNRNCGHILYGTAESAEALFAIKGEEVAKKIIGLSVDLAHEVRSTISPPLSGYLSGTVGRVWPFISPRLFWSKHGFSHCGESLFFLLLSQLRESLKPQSSFSLE